MILGKVWGRDWGGQLDTDREVHMGAGEDQSDPVRVGSKA